MDKRTIVAFALSLLVLILWSVFFAPQPEQGPAPQALEQETKKRVVPSPEPPLPSPAIKAQTVTPAAHGQKETEIVVETPLYRAVFSNVGPSIRSFQLKKYRLTADAQSPSVELVHGGEDLIRLFLDPLQKEGEAPLIFKPNETALFLEPGSAPQELVFTAVTAVGLSISQSFLIDPNRYPIELTVQYDNLSEGVLEGSMKATISNVPPQEKTSYYAFIGLSLLKEDKLEEMPADKLKKEERSFSGPIQWISYQEDYFMVAVIPENAPQARVVARSLPSGVIQGTWAAPTDSIGPRSRLSSRFMLFLGPRDLGILKESGKKLEKALNFGWTDIIAKPLLYALRFFNGYVHNYGIAIIFLTVIIKIVFWPLTHKSYKSMKEMQKLQPIMAKIREKHKGNREQMNKELMGLYKTYKVNPMGGCLPMVIQIPVFFALFRILGNSIELRHAPFIFWINDLSAPDRLFRFPFEIPFMSPPYGIPVLTLLMGASMFIQQKMTPTPGDPTQAKIMMFLPIIFTVMFINFPSGLVLYWLVNNLLSIGQQYRIIKGSK